jgi:hypothetical protein
MLVSGANVFAEFRPANRLLVRQMTHSGTARSHQPRVPSFSVNNLCLEIGANSENRTRDPLITNEVLYQLS